MQRAGKGCERVFRLTLQETYWHVFGTSLWSFSFSSFHNDTTPTGCHSFDDHLSPNQDGGKSKNVVNLGAIRQGMKRFQFLLNCCEPGTIPDASILAAALDLVSYRVLSPLFTFMLAMEESITVVLTLMMASYLFSFIRFHCQRGRKDGKVREVNKRGKILINNHWEVACVTVWLLLYESALQLQDAWAENWIQPFISSTTVQMKVNANTKPSFQVWYKD